MTARIKTITFLATALLAATVGLRSVHASGPISIYARIDKVTFEPDSAKPERIRVTGVFITATNAEGGYSTPQPGYIYCKLPAASATMPGGAWQIASNAVELALQEWNDLKSVAGTRQVVGFGAIRDVADLRIRKPDEAPASPDVFPIGNGVAKVNADQPRAGALLNYKDR